MRRIVIAIALAFVPFASGCVVVPFPTAFAPVPDPYTGKIGDKTSMAPLQVGISRRSDVIRVLGKAGNELDEDSWWYREITATGVWIWLWPFIHGGPIQTIKVDRNLIVRFGSDGRIAEYHIDKSG